MTLFYFILAFITLGFLVFIHELGHYFVARWMGMQVEVFSIGFGRPILRWKRKKVQWQLGWLPFGGFVKITGMDFGKKDKNSPYLEPHEIPHGFFAHKPWKRMLVAIAGPLANFLLALLVFSLLFFIGGRDKPFSEFTKIIGWVDPQAEIYHQGVRPGDVLTRYNKEPYTGSKDLLYAAMLGDKKVQLQGFHVDYSTEQREPFNYTVETYPMPNALKEGILTTGILSGAKFLNYAPLPDGNTNPLYAGSPLEKSGLAYGDRLVWADGYTLFSLEQLGHILNEQKALLTIRRGNSYFLSRQPRVMGDDLNLPSQIKNELIDWAYEAGIKTRWQHLYMLPYDLTIDSTVQGPLSFIDPEGETSAFASHTTSALEAPLQKGDRIVAIDGVPIQSAYKLLDHLQSYQVLLMVSKEPLKKKISWEEEDAYFAKSLDFKTINSLGHAVGTHNAKEALGNYRLLRPIQPKKLEQFAINAELQEKVTQEKESQKKKIETIKNEKQKKRAMQLLEEQYNRFILGVYLQDALVSYNPPPLMLFCSVFKETWHTLKALILGYLSPKWISGPIGIVQVIHQGWSVGLPEALFWIGAISVNLAVLNLLPIPVLDGGYILLSLWEMITRRRLKGKTMERLIIPFVILLVGLIIFLTFQDIIRFF